MSINRTQKKERIITYIDGFNLYFALKESGWRDLYWLDVVSLSKNLLKDNQNLVRVNYFTARINNNPEKEKRQASYIEALQTLNLINFFYGHYLNKPIHCPECNRDFQMPSEKMTDVNIAVQMLIDAFTNKYDKAILISADSDISGAIKMIHTHTKKKVIVAFPPGRHSANLKKLAVASFPLGRSKLLKSMLPDNIIKKDGFTIQRPESWTMEYAKQLTFEKLSKKYKVTKK